MARPPANAELKRLIGRRLTLALKRAGKRQQDMSFDLRMSLAQINRNCAGHHAPSVESLARYCAYLRISTDWVLGLKDAEPGDYSDDPTAYLERAKARAELAHVELVGAMSLAQQEGMSLRAIAERVGLSHETVRKLVAEGMDGEPAPVIEQPGLAPIRLKWLNAD